jgi:UDP-N-acetylglucosamine acyltransferase
MASIHPTAVVEPGAELGADVDIGPFSWIQSRCRIGDRSRIGPHVTVYGHTTLGAECRVHAGAVLGDLPQDTAFDGGVSYLRIGDRCRIREGVTLHRGTREETTTTVGSDCFLMAFSHVGHNTRIGDGVIVANGVLLAGYVDVGDRVFISGNCAVHQFVRIGRLAMLGGGCGASKDVPPFCTVHPISLNQLAGLNTVGLRRAGFDADQRLEIKRVYGTLFRSSLSVLQAVERIRADFNSDLALEIADFVAASKRGICRTATNGPLIDE